jgi:copper homeostasis protein (lipoprotein)
MRFQKFFLLAFLAAPLTPASHAQTPPPTPFPIPSTFTATLPCADCPAIHESLTFLPGGIALDHLVYAERNVSSQSLARWTAYSDASRLSIHSSGAAGRYSIIDANHIRKLAPVGSNTPDAYLPTFTRADKPAIPSEPLSIRGEYVHGKAASSITECDSHVTIAISPSGDNDGLDTAYNAANLKPMNPLMVKLTGKIVLERRHPDSAPAAHFQVTHFDQSWTRHCTIPPWTIRQN